jgi:hypothetical protein
MGPARCRSLLRVGATVTAAVTAAAAAAASVSS